MFSLMLSTQSADIMLSTYSFMVISILTVTDFSEINIRETDSPKSCLNVEIVQFSIIMSFSLTVYWCANF